ncbi:MAG: carboxymuconolactone decarboxylase family protein, partial [Elsteraceae bacterium]
GVIAQMDLRPILNKVKAPTLVIAGGQDPATPVSSAQEICDHVGHAELVVLPRAAHLLAVQEPAATASHLLAFLDRRTPAKARGAASLEDGLNNRRAVLGAEHVDRSLAKAGAFATPWQDYITRVAWGEMWGDPTLPWKTRSLITLAMMIALAREEEFKLHVRPALANGVTIDELQSLILHCSIYAGVPASNGAFRWAREVLGDALD